MNDVISKNSYIKGIIREIDILGNLVTFRSENYSSKVILQLLNDHPKIKEEEEEFEILSVPSHVNEGQILFDIDGSIFKANVIRGKIAFLIPTEIILCDEREAERVKREVFYRDTIVIEMRGRERKIYGELINVDDSYILIGCSDNTNSFSPGDKLEMRGYIKEGSVIQHIGKIEKVRESGEYFSYLVRLNNIDSIPSKVEITERQKRFEISKSNILIGHWPESESHKFSFELIDLGYLGFKARLSDSEGFLPPLGSIFTIKNLSIKAHLLWKNEKEFGCDIRNSGKNGLGNWQEFVEEKTNGSFGTYSSGIRNKKILNIFLRSGYLKKHKGYIFSQNEKIHEIIPSDPRLSSWIQRYGTSTTIKNKLDTHISFLRLTNTSWLIQEASSMSLEKGVGKNLILNNVEKFFYRNKLEFDLSSKIFALYDGNMSFNKCFWDLVENEKFVLSFDTLVFDLMERKKSIKSKGIQLVQPSFETWKKHFLELEKITCKELLSAFNISSSGWDALYLKSTLSESSYRLNRKINLLLLKDKCIGVAVQFGLPTIANVTSTANHLWLIVNEKELDIDGIIEDLFGSQTYEVELAGITEVVFVNKHIENKEYDPPFKRYFKLKLLSCLEIMDFVEFFRAKDLVHDKT